MKKKFDKFYNFLLNFNNKISKKININVLLVLCVIALIVVLIPILKASFYTHPSQDDYWYGTNTMNKINDVGILGVLSGSFKTLKEFYFDWQGTFSAIILFTLNPSIFGEEYYFITTFVMLGVFFVGVYILFKEVLCNHLKLSKRLMCCILILFYLVCIETMPSPTQGLFWWNGAAYYIIFFSLELINISVLIKYLRNNKNKYLVISSIVGFLIGGGNFITALNTLLIGILFIAYSFINKKDKKIIIPFIFFLIGFCISVFAPGNANRIASSNGMNPIKAIFASFVAVFKFIYQYFNSLAFITILAILVLLFTSYKKLQFEFKYPILVIVISLCLFASMFTPILYGESWMGEGRVRNIFYIAMLLFMIINSYYVIGRIRYLLFKDNYISARINHDFLLENNSFYFVLVFVVVIGCLYAFNGVNYTSGACINILNDGSAEQYDREYKERLTILTDDSVKDAVFKNYSINPYPIHYCDLSDDVNDWVNIPIAKIYNKNTVKIGG